jgi:prevent-host-death family protein
LVTTTVNVYEAKTRLSAFLALVEAGEEVIIARNGRPVARLAPLTARSPDRITGFWKGRLRIAADFDEFSDADAEVWYRTPADR